MVPISILIFSICVLGSGWFITNMLKNKLIALEKKLGEMSEQEIRNNFEIYRRTTDLEIKQLKGRLEFERVKYEDFQMEISNIREYGIWISRECR